MSVGIKQLWCLHRKKDSYYAKSILLHELRKTAYNSHMCSLLLTLAAEQLCDWCVATCMAVAFYTCCHGAMVIPHVTWLASVESTCNLCSFVLQRIPAYSFMSPASIHFNLTKVSQMSVKFYPYAFNWYHNGCLLPTTFNTHLPMCGSWSSSNDTLLQASDQVLLVLIKRRFENNWGKPERAPHLSNGVPRDLYIYVCLYVSYVIP